MTFFISSMQNPKIKQIKKLSKKNVRDEKKEFIVEGYRETLRASESSFAIKECYYSPKHFLGSNEDELLSKLRNNGTYLYELTRAVFESISYRDRPDGILCVAESQIMGIDEAESHLVKTHKPLCLIAESIEKPGNLGSILRSCDAAGVDIVFVCDSVTDIFNPNVVRSSVGTLFTSKICVASSRDIKDLMKKHGITILSASPDGSEVYTGVSMESGVAIVVGSEQYGLSRMWTIECDMLVSIPMLGAADSLNVANATTLLLYEAVRQRS